MRLACLCPPLQYLVAEEGIAVIQPNVRGSAGYGKTWLRLDNGRRRKDAVRDIGALLDWIGRQPELDHRRIGVQGGSYGGYMALASLIDCPDRIRAGHELFGISDFRNSWPAPKPVARTCAGLNTAMSVIPR